MEISSPYANCAGVNTLKDELAVRRAPEDSRWCEELDCSEHQFEASEVEKNNLGREKYTWYIFIIIIIIINHKETF